MEYKITEYQGIHPIFNSFKTIKRISKNIDKILIPGEINFKLHKRDFNLDRSCFVNNLTIF